MSSGMARRGMAGIYCPRATARPERLQRIHQALAHRIAKVEEVPVTGPAGRTPWIVADATIYNRAELCQRLEEAREPISDVELVAQAYTQWGTNCLRHLEGDYAFVLWDPGRQLLFAGRDPLGIRPFFYRWDGATLVWASEVKALVADPDYSAAPHDPMVAEFLLGWSDYSDTSATFYSGIRQLPGGHCLTVRGTQLSVERYWDIDPADGGRYRRPLQDNVEEFSALFSRAVQRRLAPHAAGEAGSDKIGTLLSGGLDSTSIASWVEKHGRENGLARPSLYYLSYFSNESEGDERAFVQSFQEKYGCPVDYLALEEGWPLEKLVDAADLVESPILDFASAVTEHWASLLHENRCGSVLTGLGGDNIFPDPGPTSFADTVQRYGWRAGWRSLRRASAHLGMPISPFVAPTLRLLVPKPAKRTLKRWLRRELPEWMQADFARRSGVLDRVRRAEPQRGFPTMSQELDYRHLNSGRLALMLGYFDRVSAAHGFEFRHPFFDASLVRFAVLAPPEHKVRDGETKVLLRLSMNGILPEAVRQRRDKGSLDRFMVGWVRRYDRLGWQKAAENVKSASAYVKPEKVREAVKRFVGGDDRALKPAWMLLSLAWWLNKNFQGRASGGHSKT